MLQVWFGLLDMGLTPTIARETARYQAGAISSLSYRQLFRALSFLFSCVAVIGGLLLFIFSEIAATDWLKIQELDPIDVIFSVQVMAVTVALRWMGGLYRGVIIGCERLVWLGGFNAVCATLRFGAVFFSMWLFGFSPTVFFLHQLVVALVELSGLFYMSQRLIPEKRMLTSKIGWSFRPVSPVIRFALTVAFTSSMWILVTQLDKLVLSGILSLVEYGYFTLAVLMASGVMVFSMPISSAVMPHMVRLYAESNETELISVYRNATQLVSVLAGSVAITLSVCAEPVIFAWTGSRDLANEVAPILRLYSIGNGFLTVAAFSYYLQFAIGNLRYHLIGSAIMVIVLVPAILIAASLFGGVGVGYVWLLLNLVFLMFWVGYVHKKIAPGIHRIWLVQDIGVICVPVTLVLLFIISLDIDIHTRALAVSFVCGLGFLALLVASVFSSYVRKLIREALADFARAT